MGDYISFWTIAVFVLWVINLFLIKFFRFLFNGNKDILYAKSVKVNNKTVVEKNNPAFRIGPFKMTIMAFCPILNVIMCVLLFAFIFYEIIMIIALVNTIAE